MAPLSNQQNQFSMTSLLFGILTIGLGYANAGTQIISVIDSQLTEYNPYMERLLSPNSGVILSNESRSIVTFEKVCQELKAGALLLLDMSSPSVGPLIRSFARSHGLVLMTILDDSLTLPVEKTDGFHIKVQPPGTAMLKVVSDIVRFEKFNKVAILYDRSFDLEYTPRNVISGVLSHHIYHEITQNKTDMREILKEVADLEIVNIFVIGASSSVDNILTELESVYGELQL